MHGSILIVVINTKTPQSSVLPEQAIDILMKLARALIYGVKCPLRYVQRVLVQASSKQLQSSNFTSRQLIAEGALLCSTPFKMLINFFKNLLINSHQEPSSLQEYNNYF